MLMSELYLLGFRELQSVMGMRELQSIYSLMAEKEIRVRAEWQPTAEEQEEDIVDSE